jgi:large subunit ribosomal protein L13
LAQKKYYRHSGYTGGLTTITADKLLEKAPEELIRKAVKGMLPKNKLGRQMFRKLKVYCGANHPHQAQQPKELQV